jgi:filamentous hemagglutinin
MIRRSLFSDRNSLSRRVLGMMASLFRRRWAATTARRSQHGRLADRLRDWVSGTTEVAARVVNSHLLTLSQPEFLEQRSMMAVTANLTGTSDTLAVWFDGDNDQAYIRQMGDTTGLLQISTTPDFGNLIYNNRVPSKLYIYDGASLSVAPTPSFAGSGYVDAPTVTVSNTTFWWQPLNPTATLNATAVNLTAGGTKYAIGDSFSVTQTGRSGASATVQVTSVDANGVINGTTITSNGSNFTSFSGATVRATTAAGTGANLTLNGSVNALNGTLGSIGYYRMPQVTIAASPTGSQATAATKITSSTTWLNGRVAVDEQSSPLTSDLRIGQYYNPGGTQTDFNTQTSLNNDAYAPNYPWAVRFDGIETVQFAGSSTGELWVQDANDISVQGAFNSASDQVYLTVLGGGLINIGAPMSVACVVAQGGANLNISGGLNAGWFDLGANNVAISGPINSNGSAMIMARNNLSVDAPISSGNGSGEYVLLQATGGALAINAPVTSSNGGITLSAPSISGTGLLTGRNLSIQEGGGAVNYSLNANVSNLSGNTASNLAFDNLRDLNIGGGALNLRGAANTLLLSSTGNLNVGANIVMQTGGNLVLNAGRSVSITGTIQPSGSPLDLTLSAANGSITSNTSLILGSGNAVIAATGNVNIPSLLANRLNVSTVAGNINITENDGVFVDNATVTGAGNITISTLAGDVGIEGIARIGGAGTATFQSNKGNIALNGSAFTQSTGSLVLNASNGTIGNGAAGSLATGTLTWIAQEGIADLLSNDAISNYSTLNANITGSGNALQVTTGRSLTLGNLTTRSGAIDVGVSNAVGSPNLAVSGTITAGNAVLGTLQNITLAAPNGAITSTGVITGNVLSLTALNSTTLANQNINQLNATISGTGQNLSLMLSRSLNAGNINLSGGTLNITVTGGNLTRSGVIDTGVNGSAILNVAQGSILGSGAINSPSLNFAAIVTPDLSVANATFTRLSASVTQSGNINLVRDSDLQIDQALTAFGDISINLSSGNLTLNGPLTAGGNGNISLNTAAGSINTTAPATGNIAANVLTVVSLNDLILQTDVNELNANVTGSSGNIAVTEKNGLIVGAGNITAANNVNLTLLAGDLTRSGAINTSIATGNVTLNIAGGGVNGNGAINAATLNWTSQSSAAINDSFLTFSNVVANVTGAGSELNIARLGDFTVLAAATASGNVSITAQTSGKVTSGNVSIGGLVTAGGAKTVLLSAAAGSVLSSNAAAVITTTGNVSLQSQNTSTLYTNVAGLTANITAGDLNVTESNGLNVLSGTGNNIVASGNVTLRVGNSVAGNLSGAGLVTAGDEVTISAPNGAVTLATVPGQITGTSLSITANATSDANTNVTNLTANIANGGLTIVEVDSIAIEPTDVVANGVVSITSTGGNITGGATAGINAGTANVVLAAPNGAVTFNSAVNQVVGDFLTINAKSDSAVNTAVAGLIGNVTAGGLTIHEANNLTVGTSAATNLTTTGDLNITLASGSLTGLGLVNAAGYNVAINVANGGVTLNTSASQVRANVVTVDSAAAAVNINTAANAVIANVTGEGNGVIVSQTGDLAINGGDITTINGSITITTTGNLSRSNDIDAGAANVTLTAGGAINGSGLITGNVLNVTANTASDLNTAVNVVTARLTGALAGLTITEADDLAVAASGISTSNGAVAITLAGDLTGSGVVNAGVGGNVTINSMAGGVNLSSVAGQVTANVLNVSAQNSAILSTNVAQLAASVSGSGENISVTEVNGLTINLVGLTTVDGQIAVVAAGDIDGTGNLSAGLGDVSLTSISGAVNLALVADQVAGTNLSVFASNTSQLNTAVANITANVTSGGLTIVNADDLTIEPTDVTAAGAIAITSTNGSILGGSTAGVNAGTANVTLRALSGNVTLNSAANQVIGGTLTVEALDDSSLHTSVANLIANITAGDLTISEANALNIGLNSVSAVDAAGNITITLLGSGSLAGQGAIRANSGAGNVSITLAGTGNVALNASADRVVADNLDIQTTSGRIDLNSAVNVVTATAADFGVAINQAQGLTINSIVVDGNVNIALSSGDLLIDTGSILGAQLSNITLNAAAGSINSVDLSGTGNLGVVFANVLDIRAANSSAITTSVMTLTANVTGDGESLLVADEDDPTDLAADGLTIGAAGIQTNGGDLTLAVQTVDSNGDTGTSVANLGGTGNISTLNTTTNVAGNIALVVLNGAATFTARAGQVTGNVLQVGVVNTSTINSNVITLDESEIGGANQVLTFNEVNDLVIANQITTANGADLVVNLGGNLTVASAGGELLADDGTTKGNVTVNASLGGIGSPTDPLNVTANVLTLRSQNNAYLNASVSSLNANVTSGELEMTGTGDVNVSSISANGVTIDTAGNIAGSGVINSANGAGNVTLRADRISLTATNQVIGNVLTVTVVNTSSLNTRVNTLTANVTGASENLTISEANDLVINATRGDLTANGGNLNVTLRSGNLTGNGGINADTGNVAISASTSNLTGTITANAVDVRGHRANLVTNVSELSANMTGWLTVVEQDDLDIGAQNATAYGAVTIAAGSAGNAGSIGGTGFITSTAANVTLTAVNGAVLLTSNTGQVVATGLVLTASGSSDVNTKVNSIVANITGANNNIVINEFDALSIAGTGVVTTSGDITITTGGALSRGGAITAGSKAPNAGADVILNINGATIGTGLITADTLNLTAVNASSVNTAINSLIATISRDGQSLSVFETAGLNIVGGDVSTNNGAIAINVASGSLKITGALSAGSANVTLNVPVGGIDASAGEISGNVLSVSASTSTRLDTVVNAVVANIITAGNVLTIVDADDLSIGVGGLRTNNGNISVTAGNAGVGRLNIANPVNAGTASVSLIAATGAINGTAAGVVSGNQLAVSVLNSSTLTTNVTTLTGTITGGNQTLSVTETVNGVNIGTGNLSATGAGGGLNVVVSNGSLSGNGNIKTASGPITLLVSNGSLNTTGSINAGTGNLAFTVNGTVTLTGTNQVAGNVLNLNATGTSALNTAINAINATITGAGNAVTISDTDGLSVVSVVTNNANVALTAGRDSAGNLALNGAVNAGTRTVSLYASRGGISTAGGTVTAANMTVVAANDVVLGANVSNFAAIVTGPGKSLTVNESNGLNVANVIATNLATISGITTNGGAIAVNVAGGSLSGAGAISAGAGNVSLAASAGAITLVGSKQVTGNVLTVAAQNSSVLGTDVQTLSATIAGAGQTLTVAENAGLKLGGIVTNNGDLSIGTATGSFSGADQVNAGSANVTLNAAAGTISLANAGQIVANRLTIRSAGSTTVGASVNSLAANVTAGNLLVNETNGLLVDSAGVRASGAVSLNLANGNLAGTGAVTSTGGNVALAVPSGSVTLTGANQVSAANLLTVTSKSSSQLVTNVANLTASVTAGSLSVSQAKNLNIVAPGINTSLGGGNVAVTLTNGNLSGAGVINAGVGNVTITATNGSVALNTSSPPPQVVGNVLTLTTRGHADVDTNVNSLFANVTSSGNLTVREVDNLSINQARTFNGAVNVSTTNASTLSVYNITANAQTFGNVTLAAGNVLVYAPGIKASGTLNLTGVGNTTVVNGTITANQVPSNTPVNWNINGNATGPGSLGDVIHNINNFNGKSSVNVTTPTTVNLVVQLPTIRKPLTLAGNGMLTLNGTGAGVSASGLVLGASGITLSGTTLRNFGGAAIDMLNGATNATITNMAVFNSQIGLRATGILTGSVVTNNTFDGLGRANSNGAVLAAARGLQLGLNTSSFNTFRSSTVGMTATGASAGTTVFGNQFASNSRYGISLAAATSLTIGHATNLTLRNMISGGGIGVFASGFCTGSSVNKMNFVSFTGTKYSVAQSRNLRIVQ